MTQRSSGVREMRETLPGTLAAAEEFILEFRRRWGSSLEAPHEFETELLLREALANAVKHGSQHLPARKVQCVLRLRDRRLIIAVRDEGTGFNWRAAVRREIGSLSPTGRGTRIYREYATRVRFNDRGNAVTLVKEF